MSGIVGMLQPGESESNMRLWSRARLGHHEAVTHEYNISQLVKESGEQARGRVGSAEAA